MLFRTNKVPPVGTELELIFALAWDSSYPVDGADVNCFGHVVRTDADHTGAAVATTITSYLFLKLP